MKIHKLHLIMQIRMALMLTTFCLWVVLQSPTLFLFATIFPKLGRMQGHLCMWVICKIFKIRLKKHGRISKHRPLLLVSNHISIFELAAFSSMFHCVFFSKDEVAKWPLIGWITKKFGNVFISRNAIKAEAVVETIRQHMKNSDAPFAIFPEGTTNNGSYVMPFKSSMFEFLAGASDTKIQPIAIIYRDRRGRKVQPQVMADEYAYFANDKQIQGPLAKQELSVMQLLAKNLMRGGFTFEAHILPVLETKGLDRKQIASALHDIVNTKFEELK